MTTDPHRLAALVVLAILCGFFRRFLARTTRVRNDGGRNRRSDRSA